MKRSDETRRRRVTCRADRFVMRVCVCMCVCVCARAYMDAHLHVCVCVCVRAYEAENLSDRLAIVFQ